MTTYSNLPRLVPRAELPRQAATLADDKEVPVHLRHAALVELAKGYADLGLTSEAARIRDEADMIAYCHGLPRVPR